MKKVLLGLLAILLFALSIAGTGCITITKEKLISLYSDGKYDLSYRLLDLKEFDLTSLTQWIRPLIPALVDTQGRAVVQADYYRGIGIIWDQYVITSAGFFRELPPVSLVPPGIDPSQLRLGAILIWDVWPGGMAEFETLEIVFMDKESGVGLLKRSPFSKFPAGPKEFPYKIGKSAELKEFIALINIGYSHFRYREITGFLLPIEHARLTVLPNREFKFGFQGSIAHYDWGGPLFAIRDGEPEFIGITTGSYLVLKEETRGIGLTAEKLFLVIEEKANIVIEGRGRGEK